MWTPRKHGDTRGFEYFGLGTATKVDKSEVTWPSGETQTLTDIEANQMLEVTEPQGEGEGVT